MKTLLEMLRESNWGRALDPHELDRTARELTEVTVPAGGYVARMGEPVTHWTGVIEGVLKMSVATEDGRAASLTGMIAGGWFGEGSLVKREARRYDVVALRDCRLALMPRATFERLRTHSLAFNHVLFNLVNARLGLFIGQLEHDRLLGPDERVARALASLFNTDLYPPAPDRFVELQQAEIGLLSGVSRQRANQALHALQDAGLILIERRGVRVIDLEGLQCYQAQRASLP